MSQVAITVKIDTKVKADVQKLAKSLGLSLSTIVENKLREVVRERRVLFEEPLVPNKWLAKEIREAKEDIRTGKNLSPAFDTAEEALAYLHAAAKNAD